MPIVSPCQVTARTWQVGQFVRWLMSLYDSAFGDTDLDATSHVGDVAMGTSLDVWSENVGRFTIGAKARNVNIGFCFKLGGAKSDGGYEEFYGQLHTNYVF